MAGHHYSGHTEIYADFTHTDKYTMMLAHEELRVVHVSTHVSLREACDRVKKARVLDVIRIANEGCKAIGIREPRVAVAGLNPHCGEGGLFGLEEIEAALPPLCLASEVCGRVSEEAAARCGLLPGTPVIGGMFDINACALAAGVTQEDRLCMIAGTWSINEYIRREPVTDGTVLMNSLFCLPEYYLIEESSPTSAGNNEWFVRTLLPELRAEAEAKGTSIYEILNGWVGGIRPDEFVPVFLPFVMGSNVHPNARGSFVGLSLSCGREHMARAVYEGIAFCHRYHLEKLLRTREKAPACIRLAGGAARSEVWAQMFADIMKLPVETVAAGETGALGCAIAAAVATGEYPDLNTAVENMTAVARRYESDAAWTETYDRKYRLYVRTLEQLDGLWDEMQAVIEGKA
jgi:L-xylulokinase